MRGSRKLPKRTLSFLDIQSSDIKLIPAEVMRRYNYANGWRATEPGYKEQYRPLRNGPPKPVVRDDYGRNLHDWTTYAMARYRAIELAEGKGLLSHSSDCERWEGVKKSHRNDDRRGT